jgi:serine protease inhibitor ecotin
MAAVPAFVASCVLVAVTVTVAAEAGAVKSPLELMVPPPLADHVTAEL